MDECDSEHDWIPWYNATNPAANNGILIFPSDKGRTAMDDKCSSTNCWNGPKGVFTAPENALYMFIFQGTSDVVYYEGEHLRIELWVHIVKDGQDETNKFLAYHRETLEGWNQDTWTIFLTLEKGELLAFVNSAPQTLISTPVFPIILIGATF